jgi:hypothetical protein
MKELGVQMIPAYSPQARGRSERSFGTWQGRLPQELRLAGIRSLAGANAFLRGTYIAAFHAKFQVAAAETGTAFRRAGRLDLEWVFTVQTQRWCRRTTRWPSETGTGSWRRAGSGARWRASQ